LSILSAASIICIVHKEVRRGCNPFGGLLKSFRGDPFERELRRAVFDRDALKEYNITMEDQRDVRAYVLHLQGHLGKESIWYSTIAKGGEAGTLALIHEVVEMRDLKSKGIDLLQHSPEDARILLEANKDSHVKALRAEYDFWAKRRRGADIRQFLDTLHPQDRDLFLESG
jgi:hypothetical protein